MSARFDGQRLKEYRLLLGWNVAAEFARAAEITKANLINLEERGQQPRRETVARIEKILKIPQIFFYEDCPPLPPQIVVFVFDLSNMPWVKFAVEAKKSGADLGIVKKFTKSIVRDRTPVRLPDG